MKKFLKIFLSLVFILSVSACVSSSGVSDDGGELSVRMPARALAESSARTQIAQTQTGETRTQSGTQAQAGVPSLVPAAAPGSARGRIVIYTSMYEDVFGDIEKAMERHFPNLDVIFVYGGTGAIQARLAREIESGRLGCDILMVAEPSYSMELKEKGILHPYRSRHASSLAFDYDREGYWYPVRVDNMVFAYNPQKYARDLMPHSFYEYAYDQTQRGGISMPDPRTSGTAMVSMTALWDRYGERYIERLGYQRTIVEPSSAALAKLERGQIRIAMVLEETVLKKRNEEGSPLEIIYPVEGPVVIPSTIVIINDNWNANRNIAASQSILDWFLSEEGQNVIVSGYMHSVRRNFARYPQGSRPTAEILSGNTMPVVWENAYREREVVHSMFSRYVKK